MRLFCRIGWHHWSCYGHKLGNPWVFYMRCLRCDKTRSEGYHLPTPKECQ